MNVWWQRLLEAIRGEYDRRIRAASQVTTYRPPDPAPTDPATTELPAHAHPPPSVGSGAVATSAPDGDDEGDIVIANVPPGKRV